MIIIKGFKRTELKQLLKDYKITYERYAELCDVSRLTASNRVNQSGGSDVLLSDLEKVLASIGYGLAIIKKVNEV